MHVLYTFSCNISYMLLSNKPSDKNNLPWVNEIRYLGIFIVSHVSFRCSTDHAKRSFYRAANAIFPKVGRFAPEEVILELNL